LFEVDIDCDMLLRSLYLFTRRQSLLNAKLNCANMSTVKKLDGKVAIVTASTDG